MEDLSHYRKSYESGQLLEGDLPNDPMVLFDAWFKQADAQKGREANAMTLSTVGQDGTPLARIVLLKGYDETGFTFFTNYLSRKGKAIEANPAVCLSFFWEGEERQVIINGFAEKIPAQASDDYFHSRPRGSQLGAHASPQSQPIASRDVLNDRLAALERHYREGGIPRPPDWGGYRVRPSAVEFWQGRPNRLHDRMQYMRTPDGWMKQRLAP